MWPKLGPSHQENETLVTAKSAGPAIWPADRIERWPIERLVPYARNARTHSDAQISQIAASIREYGWRQPVVVDANDVIVILSASRCRPGVDESGPWLVGGATI